LTDWPERLDAGAEVYLDEEDRARRIRRTEAGGRVPVLYLEGVESREAAEGLAGRYLEVIPAPLPADTYYWHQLEGLAVSDEAGLELGTLVEVFRAGGNEVYRVVGPDGERLVPALKRIVRHIDLAVGRMVVRLEPEDEETA
jgi:16S rRNA processing protein RimM